LVEPMFMALERWAPTAARYVLAAVLCWFGVQELLSPSLWTGYVPLLASGSQVSLILVAMHGELLLILSGAMLLGVAPRIAAMVAAVALSEIVASLTLSHGLNDIAMRDLGILGLAVAVSAGRQRLLLTR
jgi:uncharacterized membrane protein YphA (DoxX/SURF4 family)